MVAVGALAGLLGGAVGGGIAITVLAPLSAANNMLGSYFFGAGMILGERQMYQDDWIKIKKRLDNGEDFMVVLEEVMKPNTQAIMQMARTVVLTLKDDWHNLVIEYLTSLPKDIITALGGAETTQESTNFLLPGESLTEHILAGHDNFTHAEELGNPLKNENLGETKQKHVHSSHRHETESQAKLEETYEQLVDTNTVGSGLSRNDLIASIRFFERNLKILYTKEKQNPSESSKNLIKIAIKVLQQYKAALNFISSKNLRHTP